MELAELKAELRKKIADEISSLPEDYITASDMELSRMVISLKEFIDARNIMIYCSVKREPTTLEIAKTALAMGKTTAFPLCYRGGIMHAHAVSSLGELRPAVLGIPAPPDSAPLISPEELDLIIVPALTYDKDGYRLGYGGGYYDRYLPGLSACTVGLARQRLMRTELPREPHDVAVKCIVTEDSIRTNGGATH